MTVAAAFAVALVVSSAVLGSGAPTSAEAQARALATDFFQSINERRFAHTCDLLSAEFFRRNKIRDRRQCARGLRAGLSSASGTLFRIIGVKVGARRVVVRALADGIPGHLVLIREGGRFKVLLLESE